MGNDVTVFVEIIMWLKKKIDSENKHFSQSFLSLVHVFISSKNVSIIPLTLTIIL